MAAIIMAAVIMPANTSTFLVASCLGLLDPAGVTDPLVPTVYNTKVPRLPPSSSCCHSTSASTWLSSVKQSFAVPKAADSEAGARDEGQEELRTSLPADSMRQQQPPPFSLHQSRPLDVVREGEEGEEQHSPLPSERQAAAGGTAAAEFSALSADATVAPVLAADPVPAEAQASPADRSGSATFV